MQTSIITFDKKLDNLVGFKTKSGGYAIRKRVTPTNPNTRPQRNQRVRFLGAQALAAIFKNCLVGFAPYAAQKKISTRNAFTKTNLLAQGTITAQLTGALTSDDMTALEAQVDYAKIELSRGIAYNAGVTAAPDEFEPGTVTLKFPQGIFDNLPIITQDPASGSYTPNPNIAHYVVIYDPAKNIAMPLRASALTATATDATITFRPDEGAIPASMSGNTVHIYHFAAVVSSDVRARYYSYFDGFDDALALNDNPTIASQLTYSQTNYVGTHQLG